MANQLNPLRNVRKFVDEPGDAAAATPAAAPATPQLAAPGTRFGQGLVNTGHALGAAGVASTNAALQGSNAVKNALTYVPRVIGGFARDTSNAVAGLPASPQAGQPLAGSTAPQLMMPGQQASSPASTAASAAANPPTTGQRPYTTAGIQLVNKVLGNAMDATGQGTRATAPVITRPGAASVPAATGAASSASGPTTGVDVNGNHLSYGAMVNGVPTFSDGTGGIADTMGKDGMAQLAQQRSISRADVGAAGNVLASDVTGSPVSTADRVATLVRNANVPITGSRPSAAQFAADDRLDVASQDPRSALGTTARNLAMDAQYGTSAGARKLAAMQLAQLSTGVNQDAVLAGQGENQANVTQLQGQNQLANTALTGQEQLANTALQGENAARTASATLQQPHKGIQVKLDDGTFGLQDPITGAITRSTLPDGSPAKALTTTAPIYTSAGGQKALSDLTNNILGVDPISGMISDKNAPGGARLPTNAEQYAAMLKAQQQLKTLSSGKTTPTGMAIPDENSFMEAARQSNPGVSDDQLRAFYQKKYGKGS